MGDSPTVLRAQLGGQLRQFAADAGMRPADVAEHLGVSTSTVSKIYNGRQAVDVPKVRTLAALFKLAPERTAALVELAKRAGRPGWWAPFGDTVAEWFKQLLGLEGSADEIAVYEAELVPGLLQVPGYTEAITRAARPDITDDELSRLIEFRQARQQHLHDGGTPRMRVLLNEAVLCRRVGEPAVWREQLEHLIALGDQGAATVQVLPFATGVHPVMGSSFKLLRFHREPALSTVYLENDRSGVLLKSAAEIARYTRVFEEMSAAAATPSDSRSMLVKVSG